MTAEWKPRFLSQPWVATPDLGSRALLTISRLVTCSSPQLCCAFASLPTCLLSSLLISCVFAGCSRVSSQTPCPTAALQGVHAAPIPFVGRVEARRSSLLLLLTVGLCCHRFHAQHLPRQCPLQHLCQRQGLPPAAGEERVGAGGQGRTAAGRVTCHPPMNSPRFSVTKALSPDPHWQKHHVFFPALPNPPREVMGPPRPPTMTNLIPKRSILFPTPGSLLTPLPAGSCWGGATPKHTTWLTAWSLWRSQMFRYRAGCRQSGFPTPVGSCPADS